MSSERFTLRVNVHGHEGDATSNEDTRITLYNGLDEVVVEGQGAIVAEVPRSFYTIRLERGGLIQEKLVRHKEPQDIAIDAPGRFSAIPLDDTVHHHEYYMGAASYWSTQDTGPVRVGSSSLNQRLFVFIRRLEATGAQHQSLARGLSLRALDGRTISDFRAEEVKAVAQEGWLAFSAPAEPGTYLLHYAGSQPRALPVTVTKYWDTQVFLLYHGHARLESAALIMARPGQGFRENDREAKALDAALHGLQNGLRRLPSGIDHLLHGKFDNPWLGIVAAHAVLEVKGTEAPLLDVVLQNLSYLAPEHPDVRALALKVHGWQRGQQAFEAPPSMRPGFEAVIRESQRRDGVVPEMSLLEAASTSLYVDSLLTSWRPLHEAEAPPNDSPWEGLAIQSSPYASARGDPAPAFLMGRFPKPDPAVAAILPDIIQMSRRKGHHDLEYWARSMGVPLSLVARAVRSVQ